MSMNSDFIKAYKAAHSLGMSKEQLCSYLDDIAISTLDRKRRKVKQRTGLTLPILKSNEEDIDFETYQKFLMLVDDNGRIFPSTKIDKKKRYVVTSAQTSTPVNEDFLKTLEVYCEHNDAQLLVIPFRYTNPSSIWSAPSKEEYIVPALEKYLMPEHVELLPTLHILGDTRIVPTAIQPVHGIDALTGNASGIVGHPKVQLTTIPTPAKDLPKIMASTGAVTIKNYTQSKAGKRGEFHHSFSAIVLEIETDKKFHLRHIHFDNNGNLYDLTKKYNKSGVQEAERIPILVLGDEHALFSDKEVLRATFEDEDSIVNTLKPENIVRHDVLDGYATNTHHIGNDIISYGKHHFGRGSLEEELQITADYLEKYTYKDAQNIIVKSNHDEQIDRFLANANPKFDAENMRFYHYMKYHQLCSVEKTDTGYSSFDPFEFWCKNPDQKQGLKNPDKFTFLSRGEEFQFKNILYQFHGDRGPNGSRGSAKGMAKMGSKVVLGHSHSPAIYESVYQVGLSCKLNLEYASGQPSSWLHTHCITYPNGKRTLVNVIEGSWKL